ncbi:hypothetical protein C8R42DRAFT_692125, partial [Lentinula raphanica]
MGRRWGKQQVFIVHLTGSQRVPVILNSRSSTCTFGSASSDFLILCDHLLQVTPSHSVSTIPTLQTRLQPMNVLNSHGSDVYCISSISAQFRSELNATLLLHSPHSSSFSSVVNLTPSLPAMSYTPSMLQNHTNNLGRQIMDQYIGITDSMELVNWNMYSTSEERLHQYQVDPERYHPQPKEGLDTTAATAAEMAKSPWNRYIIRELASQASTVSAQNPAYYAKPGFVIE